MKKIIICLLVLFCCYGSIAQPVTNRGSQTITVADSRWMGLLNMFAPRYSDTTAANISIGIDSCGAIIFTYDCNCLWFRQCSPKKWVLISSINGNNGRDTLFAELPLFFDSVSRSPSTIIKFLHLNGLFSGGVVTLDSCMSIDVTAGIAFLNYKQITFAQVLGLALQPADVFDRTDAVIVDSFGVVSILKGLIGGIAPYINPSSQVLLATIPVPANAVCLSVTQIIVYDGIADAPGQWTNATAGTLSTNFINTANPFHLVQDLFVTTYTDSSTITFTKPSGTDTVKASSVLKIPVYFNGAFANQLKAQWFNGATAVSNIIVLNPFINPNDSNQYQLLVVPFGAWNFSNPVYNRLVFTFGGNDISGAKGIYFDYIQIQTGITNVATSLQLTTIGSSGAATLIGNVLNIPIYSGGGGGAGGSLQDAYDTSIVRGDNPMIQGTGSTDFTMTVKDVDIQVGGSGGVGSFSVESNGSGSNHSRLVVDNSGQVNLQGDNTSSGHESDLIVAHDSIHLTPYAGQIRIDSVRANTSTNKAILGYDTVTHRVERINISTGSGSVTSIATAFPVTGGTITTTGTIGVDTSTALTGLTTLYQSKPDFVNQTFASTITWNTNNLQFPLAKTTATGSFTLLPTNVKSGSSGTFKINTNTASSITVAFDTVNFTNKILNTPLSTYTFKPVTGQQWFMQYVADGTNLQWNITDSLINTYIDSLRRNIGSLSVEGRINGNWVFEFPDSTGGAPAWKLLGNSGTDSITNFIGTTDSKPIQFRVNNERSGFISPTLNLGTAIGRLALSSLTTGLGNTAFGYSALKRNTTGGNNTAFGKSALLNMITGGQNTAFGSGALTTDTVGIGNVAIGYNAMALQQNATRNVAVGWLAMATSTGGADNTAIGSTALTASTTGLQNTAVGSLALQTLTTSLGSTAVGYGAAYLATGAGNTAVGRVALGAVSTGTNNTAIGHLSGNTVTTGSRNIFVGDAAANGTTTTSDQLNISNNANYSQIHANMLTTAMEMSPLIMPTLPPSTVTVGGTLAGGSYFYVVTAIDGTGESYKSNEIAKAIVGTPDSMINLTWADVVGATGYKIYKGTATGVYTVYFLKTTTGFIDSGQSSTGSGSPVAGTTAYNFRIKADGSVIPYARLSTTQVTALTGLIKGEHTFDSTLNTPKFYNGTVWVTMGTIAGSFSGVGVATTVFTVTIGNTMANATYKVNVTPTSALSAALFYVTNKTTTTFDVTYLAGLSGTVTFDYLITQ